MRKITKANLIWASIGVVCLVLLPTTASAQEETRLAKKIFIQGNAMGQSTQLGRQFSFNVIINELSTAADQKVLLEAFKAKGNEGLVNAISKMKGKGRISITGTVGYDVNYIRVFKQPDGTTKIRMMTDRPITFGEAWSDSRSRDYDLSGMEIVVTPDKKASGILLPACQFKMDKNNQIEIEAYQNPWKLVNVKRR
jgi:hypothetical protein